MKQIREAGTSVSELSQEELQNTYGGSWWEMIVDKDGVTFIFHLYDDDMPK